MWNSLSLVATYRSIYILPVYPARGNMTKSRVVKNKFVDWKISFRSCIFSCLQCVMHRHRVWLHATSFLFQSAFSMCLIETKSRSHSSLSSIWRRHVSEKLRTRLCWLWLTFFIYKFPLADWIHIIIEQEMKLCEISSMIQCKIMFTDMFVSPKSVNTAVPFYAQSSTMCLQWMPFIIQHARNMSFFFFFWWRKSNVVHNFFIVSVVCRMTCRVVVEWRKFQQTASFSR